MDLQAYKLRTSVLRGGPWGGRYGQSKKEFALLLSSIFSQSTEAVHNIKLIEHDLLLLLGAAGWLT